MLKYELFIERILCCKMCCIGIYEIFLCMCACVRAMHASVTSAFLRYYIHFLRCIQTELALQAITAHCLIESKTGVTRVRNLSNLSLKF